MLFLLPYWACVMAGNPTLDPVFVNATLQHAVVIPVWGTAEANANVTVILDNPAHGGGATIITTADANGNWSAKIPPQPAGYGHQLLISSNGYFKTMVNFGLVVLCSGQSNMGMPVGTYDVYKFHADNGTAECAAAGRYSNQVSLLEVNQMKYMARRTLEWAPVEATPTGCKPNSTHWPYCVSKLAHFSAVCWYTGRALADQMGPGMPIGLIEAAVGGSPIEYWLPPTGVTNTNPCEMDKPQCDTSFNDSWFFVDIVQQLTEDPPDTFPSKPGLGFTYGALVWDQAERDVKCPTSLSQYACMQAYLTTSWRERFSAETTPFVTVQLPGYTAALINGTGNYNRSLTSEQVFDMRLQQVAGTTKVSNASYVPTYDLSCPTSPYGSVHNVEKGPIGKRVADQILLLLDGKGGIDARTATGPRVESATFQKIGTGTGNFEFKLALAGGTAPWGIKGTKNCTTCCSGSEPTGHPSDAHTVDLDVGSSDGVWLNATGVVIDSTSGTLTFQIGATQDWSPVTVRHTGASIFPQCAVYAAEKLPLIPFKMMLTELEESTTKIDTDFIKL